MKISASVTRFALLPVFVVIVTGGCGSGTAPASGPPVEIATPIAAPSDLGASSAVPSADGAPASPLPAVPPAASLAVEGGDPVVGQLGTYTWGETGSDAPWLPGAPIQAATGEPLAVTLEPDVAVATWEARRVPASADGPEGSIEVGSGSGAPAMAAPEPGSWTLVVTIEFADRAGTANYFWQLDVP
jgi:hypothetical protein